MKEEVMRFHNDTISQFNNELYDSLIYERHISSESLKEVDMKTYDDYDEKKEKRFRGYFAIKDKLKYLIGQKHYQNLPIRITDVEKYRFQNDVVLVPKDGCVKPFKIVPKHKFSFRQLILDFAPFQHSEPEQYKLLKICVLMQDIGRGYICISSKPNGGKSSLFKLLNSINNRTPTYQPRSIPGCMNRLTSVGNVVWDDIMNVPTEARKAMEDISMQVADGSSFYINGAMKSHATKSKYDTRLQSITYLYNNIEFYANPHKKYFDNMFVNNGALDDRFLKLKFDGILTQKFHRDFDIVGTAKKNRQYYIDFAKELMYLQEYKQSGQYVRRWNHTSNLSLKGRKRIVYDEICWGIDQFSESQEEYHHLVALLDSSIISYKEMVNQLKDEDNRIFDEEVIE